MAITNNFPTGGSSSIDLSRTLIASYTTAGTYTWTVPEEIKKKGFVDVYIMGGGGSGGAAAISSADDSTYVNMLAMGGASGYTTILTNFPVANKTSINIVVGAGGASAVANNSNSAAPSSYSYAERVISANGLKGGTTKFDVYEALGGDGGIGKACSGWFDSISTNTIFNCNGADGGSGGTGIFAADNPKGIANCVPGSNGSDGSLFETNNSYSAETGRKGKGIGINNVVNKYDTNSIMGAAGGLALFDLNLAVNYVEQGVTTTYGASGTGKIGAIGNSATGNGNGGGGCVYHNKNSSSAISATSGAGAPGLVLIYG